MISRCESRYVPMHLSACLRVMLVFAGIAFIALLDQPKVLAGGLSRPTSEMPGRTAKETTRIGHLSWEITETSSGKVLGRGSKEIKASDVQVFSDNSDYLEQRIPLSEGFYLKLNAGRDKAPFIGFGIAAGKEDEVTFCWEWFNVEKQNRARKIQESGELEFQVEQVGEYWEIAQTRFVSDVSMRVIQWATKSGHEPTWRVKIHKDSQIEWPTVARKKVLLVRDADAWLASHPPEPGFWDRLVKAAEESSSTATSKR